MRIVARMFLFRGAEMRPSPVRRDVQYVGGEHGVQAGYVSQNAR